MSTQPDPKLFATSARGRRLKDAEDDIEAICNGVVERALNRADSVFDSGDLDPARALQLLAEVYAARVILRRFRKAVKDGVAASDALYGGTTPA